MTHLIHTQEWPSAQHFEVYPGGSDAGGYVEANKVGANGGGVSFFLDGKLVGSFKPGTEWRLVPPSPSMEDRVSTPESRGDYST